MPRQNQGEPYYRVDSPEALQILNADPDNTVVVDVRRDDEWVTGHASGAIHINVDEFMDRVDELPEGKKLLFICAAGVRSGVACEYASALGVDSDLLYNVDDGRRPGLPPATPRPTATTRN